MSIGYPVRPEFVPCPACAAKPGTPGLCRECVERRALYAAIDLAHRALIAACRTWRGGYIGEQFVEMGDALTFCGHCEHSPTECPEHVR